MFFAQIEGEKDYDGQQNGTTHAHTHTQSWKKGSDHYVSVLRVVLIKWAQLYGVPLQELKTTEKWRHKNQKNGHKFYLNWIEKKNNKVNRI